MISEKQRSSLTATRQPVTGQVVVLPQQDMDSFTAFTAALVASLVPFDAHEQQLAQCYAGFQWRINRVAALEDALFSLGLMEDVAGNLNLENAEVHNAASNAKAFRTDARAFDRLSVYSQRLIAGAAKVLKQLEQTQARRREREQQQLAEAARLYQFHRMNNQRFDPQENGFDLTLDKIRDHLHCTILHKQAKLAESFHFNRQSYDQAIARAAA